MNNTQIFARISADDTQFLVYQMNYESQHENAMILPIPIRQPAHEKSLRFIDLNQYDDFFDDLASGFPYNRPGFSVGCASVQDPSLRADLEVFEVGNYIASFAPQRSDLSRLDARFTLPEDTWSQMPQYEDYGFAVFQLAEGSLKPHPMAFEFEHVGDSIFFPTVHVHDGQIHETERFDHMLYLQHAGFDSRVYGYQNSNVPDKTTGLVRSRSVAKDFCNIGWSDGIIAPDLLVHRHSIRGNYPNRDTRFPTFGDPTIPTLNLRPWLSYTPWLIFAAAVTWLLARRSKIRRMKKAQ